MPASKYDIKAEQGSTFRLHLHYKTGDGDGIDLSGFGSRMQVRRSSKNPKILLYMSTSGVTGGGTTGDFSIGGGVQGTGGIRLNASTTGQTGANGLTGGIYMDIDNITMSSVPEGRHLYDLELINTTGDVQRLIEGFFEVTSEITRT
jgi:hypothetical protein